MAAKHPKKSKKVRDESAGFVDTILAWTGGDPVDLAGSKADLFRRLLFLGLAVEGWEAALQHWKGQPLYGWHVAVAVLLSLAAAGAWVRNAGRSPTVLALAGLLLEIGLAFPNNANHHWLGLVCCVLLFLFGGKPAAERVPLLQGLRWLVVIGLFWAGLRKVLYGYYFTGVFLSYAIAQNSRFSSFFALFVPDAEVGRLQSISFGVDAGPYRVDTVLFKIVSNMAYLPELVLPPLLLFSKTRKFGLYATLAYIVAIEAGARELFFGLLMLNLLLLFSAGNLHRRVLWFVVAAYAYLLSMAVGLLPHWYFT